MRRPHDFIIFPLDVPDFDLAMKYVKKLKEHVGLFKVGLELFIRQGPDILKAIHEIAGSKIFLDLKFHDIPATVTRAFIAAASFSPEFITVHCDSGENALRSAAEKYNGRTKLLAVTLLTSMNRDSLSRLGYREEYLHNIPALVLSRAEMAKDAGCQGVVCSGHEVSFIKARLGNSIIAVTPGIRPSWSLVNGDDQKRVITPQTAVKNGADYIVIGRPIRDARDPVDAANRVAEEIESGLREKTS
ncbi:MAG: orotidine-5'-phosphate decarboxylase [Deltaproteobacteria bacterium]|nr:orotidine-5'-phosphate decarboxylase [Deltaproteobacteria bacterium]